MKITLSSPGLHHLMWLYLEKRRANVQRFGEAAREKAHRASVLATYPVM